VFALTEQLQIPHKAVWQAVKYLSSYSKLVDLRVSILFMRYQKMKVSCVMVLRDERTCELTTEMLSRGNRTSALT